MIDDAEWNFSTIRNDSSEALKVFLWEYGRECQPLINLVEEIKGIIVGEYQFTDGEKVANFAYQVFKRKGRLALAVVPDGRPLEERYAFSEQLENLREKLDALVGNFNLGLFFSQEFPDMPWFDPQSKCGIKHDYEPWPKVIHKFFAHVPYFHGDPKNYGTELFGDSESESDENFHCFIIPDGYFDWVPKEDMLADIKQRLDQLNRRKITPSDLNAFKLSRDNVRANLRWLAAMRVLHYCDESETNPKHGNINLEILDSMNLMDMTRFSDHRRDAAGMFCQFFCLPEGKPISWPVHPSRADDFPI